MPRAIPHAAAVADPSGPRPTVADQCDPRTAIVFEPTETLIIQRWDKRRQRTSSSRAPRRPATSTSARLTDGCETPRPTSPRSGALALGTRPRFGGPLARAPRLAHAPFRGGVRVLVHRRRRHRPPHQAPRTRRGAPGRARRPVQTPPSSDSAARGVSSPATLQTHRREGHRPRTPPRPPRCLTPGRLIVRRRPRERPATALRRRSARLGLGPEARNVARGSRRLPARDPTTGLPTAATSLEDAADASRRRYGVASGHSRTRGVRVSGLLQRAARQTRRRRVYLLDMRGELGSTPKYTDAASFHAAQRAPRARRASSDASPAIRPASARPATATTRLVAGEGRGGGRPPRRHRRLTASRAALRVREGGVAFRRADDDGPLATA